MSRIRSSNTSPERIVRSTLHALGFRFRLHRKDLPGSPDVVLPKYKTAIFVHGCFWHRHKGCKFAYTPKSRLDFWLRKFEENVLRDRRVKRQIQKLGWRPLVIWECQTRQPLELSRRLARLLPHQ
jgi:DNA mismatch endonuclease, patch repair protein